MASPPDWLAISTRVAAEAAYELAQPLDVLDHLEDALMIARQREDAPRLVAALLLRLVVVHDRSEVESAQVADELQQALATSDIELPAPDVLRLFELADHLPSLVPTAVVHGGFDWLTPKSARQLARPISELDRQASERLGERPGLVARSAGLSVGSGESAVTRAWEDLLARGGPIAVQAVRHALDHGVPARSEVISALARCSATWHATANRPRSRRSATWTWRSNQRRLRQLAEILLNEVGLNELMDVAASEFDLSLSSIASLDEATETVIREVIAFAQRSGLLGGLIIALRNRRPGNPQLFAIANELDLSAIHYSSKRLAEVAGKDNIGVVLGALGAMEGRIARIEHGDTLVSTGVLVSPELVVVAGSSLDRLGDPNRIAGLLFRFGMKADGKGRRRDDGVTFSLGPDGIVDRFRTGSGSDVALLHVDGYPADEPLGGSRGQRSHERRGFLDVSISSPPTEGQNALLCWQQEAGDRARASSVGPCTLMGMASVSPASGQQPRGRPCSIGRWSSSGSHSRVEAVGRTSCRARSCRDALRERGHEGTVGVALV